MTPFPNTIHTNTGNEDMITIAVPTGRLQKQVFQYFISCGIQIDAPNRHLIIQDKSNSIRFLLVKNSDLPEYVNGGISSIGIVGTDVINESPHSFFTLGKFPFGSTRICLIAKPQTPPINSVTQTTVGTKYTQFTKHFLSKRNINANIITLKGSVEIAPLLGLSTYIIDLVETGKTIEDNKLTILEEIDTTKVVLIANKALYKLNYKAIDKVVRNLKL